MKIPTEIILEDGSIQRKKPKVDGNHIILRAESKRKGIGEWAPEFNRDCLLKYSTGIWPFKSQKEKLVVFEDAERCIEWDGKAKVVDPATWDRRTLELVMKKKVLDKAGEVNIKAQVPLIFYITFFLVVLLLILQIVLPRLRIV